MFTCLIRDFVRVSVFSLKTLAKPYLSLIIPATADSIKEVMLALMQADCFLEKAEFDYEIIVPAAGLETYDRISKFAQVIKNTSCLKASEQTVGELLRYGLSSARGALRSFAFKNGVSFLKSFSELLPHIKGCDAVVGPRWHSNASYRMPQLLSAIIHSPYQFQVIREEALPAIMTTAQTKGWEFFSESYARLRLSGKSVKSAGSGEFPDLPHILDLHVFRGATTIRLHSLYWKTASNLQGLAKAFVCYIKDAGRNPKREQ